MFHIALFLSGLIGAFSSTPCFGSDAETKQDQTAIMLTQRSEAVSSEGQGPSPAIDLSPGGASIEDLLLPKGTIPTNE